MIRVPRDRRPAGRFLELRIGLVFLGAGVWLGGVLAEDPRITGAAIVILVAAAVLGMVDRRNG